MLLLSFAIIVAGFVLGVSVNRALGISSIWDIQCDWKSRVKRWDALTFWIPSEVYRLFPKASILLAFILPWILYGIKYAIAGIVPILIHSIKYNTPLGLVFAIAKSAPIENAMQFLAKGIERLNAHRGDCRGILWDARGGYCHGRA